MNELGPMCETMTNAMNDCINARIKQYYKAIEIYESVHNDFSNFEWPPVAQADHTTTMLKKEGCIGAIRELEKCKALLNSYAHKI